MPDEPTALAYALPEDQAVLWRQARVIFAGFATAYGVAAIVAGLVTTYSYWATAALPWPFRMQAIVSVVTAIPIGIGGLLSLRGRPAGPIVLRYGAAASVIGNVTVNAMLYSGIGTPGMAVGGGMVIGLRLLIPIVQVFMGVPLLLFLLSFPLRDPPR